jgi:hypothetical protein
MSGRARMLDGYLAREQDRAALQWRASCTSDDALKRRIDTRLSAGPLPTVMRARRGSLKKAAHPLRMAGHLGSLPVTISLRPLLALPEAKGVVQLTGFVGSQADIEQAVKVASRVASVKAVKNDMRIK